MHTINIRHQSQYMFSLEIDGEAIELSYKSVGGRDALLELGEERLFSIIIAMKDAISNDYRITVVHDFFETVGCANAMKIIEITCPDEFCDFWRKIAQLCKCEGRGYSFRKVLQEISGTKATLGHSLSSGLMDKLRNICEKLKTMPNDDVAVTVIENNKRIVSNAGITVCFSRCFNNSAVYIINGKEVVVCKNRAKDIETVDSLFCAAKTLRAAISQGNSIKPYTERWGGSFVFRVLGAVCEGETLSYFESLAEAQIDNRYLPKPHKTLENLNYAFNDKSNSEFISKIMHTQERVCNRAGNKLIAGNDAEIMQKENSWRLYYLDGGKPKFVVISFFEIENACLKSEGISFLRDLWHSGKTHSVTQIARYFHSLRDGLNSLESPHISSISQVNVAHARKIKSHMDRTLNCSPNAISEALQVLGRMYYWSCHINCITGQVNNPFWIVTIPNKRAYLKTTKPADRKTLQIVIDNINELPECVRLAFKLMLLTLARAYDIFHLGVGDVLPNEHGETVLKYIASKNHRPMSFRIPSKFVAEILAYVERTEIFRQELGEKGYLLIYKTANVRAGSARKPEILNSEKFSYHLDRLLEKYAPNENYHITPRQIRAEGGRRYHAEGRVESDIAIMLGNTPNVAKKHYGQMTPRDEAELYHRAYQRYFEETSCEEIKETENICAPLWGSCSANTCAHKNVCTRCSSLNTLSEEDKCNWLKN